ncbi:MAG: hypothetical protein CME71_11940 [Halobacteriovorax sp.]|nr:hypothetical protein [Halobacteriovorax sp.]|tara:strand:- start:57 stop:725 length:669 start_codon:yes stop_codon:yes gene_type:complete
MSYLIKILLLAFCLQAISCAKTQLAKPVFLVSDQEVDSTTLSDEAPSTLKSTKVIKKNKKQKAYEAPDTKTSPPHNLDQEDLKTSEVSLALITTDYSSKTYELVLSRDDQDQVKAIKTINNKGKEKIYPLSVLNREIVLAKAVGVSLVTLRCHNFSQETGCPLEIEYPSNVTYGKFLRFKANLVKRESGWQLESGNRKFTSMHLVAKKFFGLLIGVERLELR